MKKTIYLFTVTSLSFFITNCENNDYYEEVDSNIKSVDREKIRRPGSQKLVQDVFVVNSKNLGIKNESKKDYQK